MKTVRVALAQFAPKLGEPRANLEIHLDGCRRAVREHADVIVFPELSLTGYLLQDQVPDVAVPLDAPLLRPLLRVSREVDVVFGFVEEGTGHRFYNAGAYLSRGKVIHVHRKVFLPTYGMFEEGRDLAPGDKVRRFDTPHGPAGILICEDAWHPICAWLLAQQGAEILFALSSGPSRGTRPKRGVTSVAVWTDLLRVTAQFQTSFVVYVNRVGYEDGLNFGGGSVAIDPFGRTIAALPALDEGFTVAELDAEVLRRARTAYPLLRDENLDLAWREIERLRDLRYDLPQRSTRRKPDPPRRAAR